MPDWKDYENVDTLALIDIIKGKCSQEAEAALKTFIFRYRTKFVQICDKVCDKWGYDEDVAIEIAEKTFLRFGKYANFDISYSTTQDIDNAIILYLSGIARNLLRDYHNIASGKIKKPYSGKERIITEIPNYDAPKLSDDQKRRYQIIQEALETLSTKHRIIYLTYKAYEMDGFKLPRFLLEDLRQHLDISQNTVRSYKNEAFNKVDEYLRIYGKAEK